MRMNVVFPAPFGPRMATGLPVGRVKVRSERACTFPNRFAEAFGLDQGTHRRPSFRLVARRVS